MNTLWLILRQESTIRIGWVLIHFLWQAAVVGVVTAILLRLLRKCSPQARYMALCLSLLVMAMCPVITYGVMTAMDSSSKQLIGQLSASEKWRLLQGTALLSQPITFADIIERNLPAITVVWAVGVILLSLRMIGGMWLAQRLAKRQAKPITGWLLERSNELSRSLGIRCAVPLRESPNVQVPAVVGCFRSVILFPVAAMTGLPASQVEALLAHELAHVRRHDYLVNLLQTIAETVLFYHPVVWWVSRRIRIERENCCDDMVLTLLSDRRNYALALASLEEIRTTRTTTAVAATGGELLPRIRRILGEKSMTTQPNYQWVAVLGMALAIAPFAVVKLQAEPPIVIASSKPAVAISKNNALPALRQDDVAALKARIKSLEAENKRLKAQASNRDKADLDRDIVAHQAAAREEVARAQALQDVAQKERAEELARLRTAEAEAVKVREDQVRELSKRNEELDQKRADEDQALAKSRVDLAQREADLALQLQKKATADAQNRDQVAAEVQRARALQEEAEANKRDIVAALEDRVRASKRDANSVSQERLLVDQVRRSQKSNYDAQIRQLRDQNKVLQKQMRELQNQIKALQKQQATGVRP